MPTFTTPIHEGNDCHNPAGSPAGGEFCSTGRPQSVHPLTGEPLKRRTYDEAARLAVYRGPVQAVLQRASKPLERYDIIKGVRKAGVKAVRTVAGGYEDQGLLVSRILTDLMQSGDVAVDYEGFNGGARYRWNR